MRDVKVFIDSTTFLYANDMRDPGKRLTARRWLEELTITNAGRTNLQVLNEVTNVLIRKAHHFEPGNPFVKVDTFADFGSTPVVLPTVVASREIYTRNRYAWWDCLLLASALELGCRFFLSEDLQDGQIIEGLTIVDPFAHSPDQIFSIR